MDFVKLPVARGADVGAANSDGFSVLHALAETNRPEQLGWLLSPGLDLEARTKHGHTLKLSRRFSTPEATGPRDPSNHTARDIAQAQERGNAFEVLTRQRSS